ncbi:hypothetical protein JCM10207_003574 [Rhodosporidiobolus poonsookiae]
MAILATVAHELGLHHLTNSYSNRDVALILVSRFVRLVGFGAFAPVLILFLRSVDIPDERVGLFLSATLAGDVLVSLFVTWSADSLGRRNMLALGSLLMAVSGLVFYYSDNFVYLLLAAIVGIISPSGNETGPFSALEQAALSQLTEPAGRVALLMWYQVLGFFGISAGNVLTNVLVSTAERAGKTTSEAFRTVFLAYAVIAAVKLVLSLVMTRNIEVDHPPFVVAPVEQPAPTDSERQPLLGEQPQVRADPLLPPEVTPVPPAFPLGRLVALCLIFGLDSFASSLIPMSYISYFLRSEFGAPLALITRLFSVTSLIGCASQLLAGSISKRLGIILTMVATHMPAQIFTIGLGLAPSLPLALTFFVCRACIASMDSSVRGAFLAAVIPKSSRTRFLGVINICKTLASTPGPTLALGLAAIGGMRWTFVIAGAIKLLYDVALFVGFKAAKLEH